ncbi:ThiF family adenylyltransferase [Pseudomonas kairouanensis]|uniref:ThiF family adenylyltransferase n=1 Tax=Pseudomonas kairouanensis TaxID=2293832 RepID=A0A4Z0API3_9PSED|nr:ThiF family adenylyltransferase [Pseudomonas kairouanensis]TFY88303.1 ThiF family adenylyltransferase [Pseudomonas kairouanensis]
MIENFSDFCFYDSSGSAIGVVAPSTFHSRVNEQTVISGPHATVRLTEQTLPALTEGLLRSGALVPGSSNEVAEVCEYLKDPETSRTASFFLCKAKTCADIISVFKKIKNANVLLIGCGGIGSTAALLLAGGGVGSLTLVDPDVVELSNLNRQLFWRKLDVGKSKVSILDREIQARFDGVQVSIIKKELDFYGIVELASSGEFSVVVITADNPATLVPRAEELASILKIPVVSGGYLHSHCIASFYSGNDIRNIPNEQGFDMDWEKLPGSIMPSFGPLNFTIASLLSAGVLTFLASSIFGNARSSYIEWDAAVVPTEFSTKFCYDE